MKIYKLIFFLNFIFFATNLSAQEKSIVEEHIVHSINMIMKLDFENWKKTNVRPFKAKTKIDTIRDQTLVAMDFMRGYEAFKDYKNLKLKSINKVQTVTEHFNKDESTSEYSTAFIMQDSISGKEYGFVAEDIFWSNKELKGFKIIKNQNLSSITIDKLWQDYLDKFIVKREVAVARTIIKNSIYTGNWKGETISLKWETEQLAENKKSYSVWLNQNQKTPIKLQLKTTNHKNYLLITDPYLGHFILTKYDNMLKGFYFDANGKKHKIKWMKHE